MIIYHNPRCRKSREGLELIRERGEQADIREYMKEPMSKTEFTDLLRKLDMNPSDLLRRGEKVYKEKYKGRDIPEEEWVDIMLQEPRLIERPIVVRDDRAVVGRPKERIEELLK